jgi:hypothetical protein
MKKLLILAFALSPSVSYAASVEGHVYVEIRKPLNIIEKNSIDFGIVIPNGNSGTVEIDTSDNINCPTGWECIGTAKAGEYSISGEVDADITIKMGDSNTATLSNGVDEMTFVADDISGMVKTDSNGKYDFVVTGKLLADAGQAEGVYSTHMGKPFSIEAHY